MNGLRGKGTLLGKRRAESALRSILGAPPWAQLQLWQLKTASKASDRYLPLLVSVEGRLYEDVGS